MPLAYQLILTNMTCRNLSLKDNCYWGKEIGIYSEIDKNLLHTLSSPVNELVKEKDLLIFPQSFSLGDGESSILSYSEASNRVYTNNMMGFVGSNGFNIRIHSSFDNNDNDFFLHYMLMRISGINLFDLPTGYSPTNNIYDLLIFLFPSFLNDAMSVGLMKMYVEHEYNDDHVRGMLDIQRHIKKNKPNNGRVAYKVREYSFDNPINELIRHCIEYIKLTSIGRKLLNANAQIRNNVSKIIEITPTFKLGEKFKIIQKNHKTIVHPLYKKYTKLQKLCLAILQHKKIAYDYNDNKIHGIVFDGAWLWEEYLAVVLRNKMKHCTRNTKSYYLFDNNRQRIIPDFLSFQTGNNIVGDAKYIHLDKFAKGEIREEARAEAIYYKTIMYMLRFNSHTGYLFYPLSKENNEPPEQDFTVLENDAINKRHLFLVGLKITNSSSKFKAFCNGMKEEENNFLARLCE